MSSLKRAKNIQMSSLNRTMTPNCLHTTGVLAYRHNFGIQTWTVWLFSFLLSVVRIERNKFRESVFPSQHNKQGLNSLHPIL